MGKIKEASIDIITDGKAFGSIAARLLANNMNPQAIRTCDVLQYEEWQLIDKAVVKAAYGPLKAVADLQSKGLVYPISNGLGTTVLASQNISDVEDAQVTMTGAEAGRKDRVEFDTVYLPLPVIHYSFEIDVRVLMASRNKNGPPLDTTMAEAAARKVAEKAEELLIQGSSTFTFGGGTIYGYEDFPHRNTVSLSQTWDASGKTGEEILDDVLSMIQAAENDNHFGPFMLYVPVAYSRALNDQYSDNYPATVRSRLLELASIAGIQIVYKITADHVILAEMQSDTVRLVEGLQPTTVQWSSGDGMIQNFKVMCIWVPQIRANQDNKCGIVDLS